ncbi:HNH endonuclease [Mycobacterium phage ScoobyDoobyDoo]|nr:HNH endonuclease [Mycobacterium phage ScoobyDoobyDoo]
MPSNKTIGREVFRSLGDREIVIPYLKNAMLADNWPEEYTVKVDSRPYYGLGDGYFHPSTHGLMGERQLYYMFHPDHRQNMIHEDRTVQDQLTLSMGSALHAVCQTQFQMAGILRPENCELEFIIEPHHIRGRADMVVDHPTEGELVVEFKALAVDTPVLTTGGWSTMGELQDGDEVYAPDGQPTKVLAAHPVRHNRPCYRVSFRDGQSVVADEDHLWEVMDRNSGLTRVMTTKDIAEARWGRGYRFSVPIASPVQTPEVELPVDPWLLGMWIGDGDKSMVSITSGEQDIDYLQDRISALGLSYRVNRYGDRAASVYIHGLRKALSDLGLLGSKHIPESFMRASEVQRRQLLAGILDADGSVSDHQVAVGMVNEPLMRQVLQLVRSLGYRATWREHRARLNGQDAGPVYWVKFSTGWGENPFGMPRKREAFDSRTRSSLTPRNSIVSVDPVDSVPTRCITVAHESSLYLVGDGFVPTHNTQNSRAFAFQEEMKDIWKMQLSIQLYGLGKTRGILLVMESGHPYQMREYHFTRDDDLLARTFAKFDYVRECIENNTPPPFCCAKGSKDMKKCPARWECWLKSEVRRAG